MRPIDAREDYGGSALAGGKRCSVPPERVLGDPVDQLSRTVLVAAQMGDAYSFVGVEPGVGCRAYCEAASFGAEAAKDAAVNLCRSRTQVAHLAANAATHP